MVCIFIAWLGEQAMCAIPSHLFDQILFSGILLLCEQEGISAINLMEFSSKMTRAKKKHLVCVFSI